MMEKNLCPACRKEAKRNEPYFPFCSERCKLIDLGKWAGDEYRIKGGYAPTEGEK
ncbi:MAG: DNA gyrase inhibitor YacG [Mariprofundaceae bacterium]